MRLVVAGSGIAVATAVSRTTLSNIGPAAPPVVLWKIRGAVVVDATVIGADTALT